MGKTIEICHFKSFDRLLEKADELERYFQPPTKPDEHYKLVFKKKSHAQVSVKQTEVDVTGVLVL